MASPDPAPAAQQDAFGELLRGSLVPTLVAAAGCAVVGLLSSLMAAWSSIFGAAMVVVFFAAGLTVMKFTAHLAPSTVMAMVMLSYTLKVVLLGLTLFLVRDATWLSGFAAGVTITICTLVWLIFEMRSYRRLRIFVYDPKPAGEGS